MSSIEERFTEMISYRDQWMETAEIRQKEIDILEARVDKLELRLRIYEKAFTAGEEQ